MRGSVRAQSASKQCGLVEGSLFVPCGQPVKVSQVSFGNHGKGSQRVGFVEGPSSWLTESSKKGGPACFASPPSVRFQSCKPLQLRQPPVFGRLPGFTSVAAVVLTLRSCGRRETARRFLVLQWRRRTPQSLGKRRTNMRMAAFRMVLAASFVSLAVVGCASTYREAGSYRIVAATDGFGGLFCQPRTEFYFIDPSSQNIEPTYLGTCGTPLFLTNYRHVPEDPSCFAISEDGASIVYYHRPEICGAGKKALRKPGGVYLHSAREGDRLLYPESQVNQQWGGGEIGQHSLRIGYTGATRSRSGAVCSQTLIINASGEETHEGKVNTRFVTCNPR